MKLVLNKIGDRLSGMIGEQKYNVPFSAELYASLKDAEVAFEEATTLEDAQAVVEATLPLVQVKVQEIVTTKCIYLVYNNATNKYYLKNKDVVSSHPMPKALVDWIIESVEKEIDFMPVVKAWTRFLRNPNFSSSNAERFAKYLTTTVVDFKEKERLIAEEGVTSEIAEQRATFRDVSLTRNGLISTYKYGQIKYHKFDEANGDEIDRYEKTYDAETGHVTVKLPEFAEDYYLIPPVMGEGYDAVTIDGGEKAHRIKVGSIHTLAWNQVDTHNDQMSKGLWIGGLSYIKTYDAPDRLLMNCFVDPANIGSFYRGGGLDALKVKEYFVHSAVFAPNKNLYRESDYDAHTQKEWNKLRDEAIELANKKVAEIQKGLEEINSL
jgi:hypothetical protein